MSISSRPMFPVIQRHSFAFSVPISRLPDLVYETKKDIEKSRIVSTIVGHVGDGKVHLN